MNENRKPMVVFYTYSPYIVVGQPPCINSKGETIQLPPVATLCRCGKSENKPFCDGTHGKIGFAGIKEPDRREDKVIEYPGKEITIFDNRGVCSADGACVRESPKVFQNDKKPDWVFPNRLPNAPRFSVTACEWINAVPTSQGMKEAFSTGSQNQ